MTGDHFITGEILENVELIRATIDITDNLKQSQEEAVQEMEVVAGLIEKAIKENSTKVQDQIAYEKRYKKLSDRYEKARTKNEEFTLQIAETQRKIREIDRFSKELKKADSVIEEFDIVFVADTALGGDNIFGG